MKLLVHGGLGRTHSLCPTRRRAAGQAHSLKAGHATKASIAAATDKPKATAKVGCPWQLKLTCYADSPESMSIDTPVGHQGHQPGSAEDNALLKPSKEVEARIGVLLKLGVKPTAVMAIIDHRQGEGQGDAG